MTLIKIKKILFWNNFVIILLWNRTDKMKTKKILIVVCLLIIVVLVGVKFIMKDDKETKKVEEELPVENKELFEDRYTEAEMILADMTLEQKVAQLFLVKYDAKAKKEPLPNIGGYVLFGDFFKNETIDSYNEKITKLKNEAKINYTIAVDEEGGTVTRVSSNKAFRNEKFSAPREIYAEGGLDLIKETEQEKIDLLKSLQINLNLAPVSDISTNENDFMYERSIGLDATNTASYISTVTKLYKDNNFASCLKHFPGYGNNVDTHVGSSTDNRTLEELKNNDLIPFVAGIKAESPYILVSHNSLPKIDSEYPASLSAKVINVLKEDLGYTGLVITDDISMDALDSYDNIATLALLAGNDVIITGDYNKHYEEILNAVKNQTLSEERINNSVKKILAWKLTYNII